MICRLILSLLLASFSRGVLAQKVDDEGLRFFEQKIRPVLVQHCYSCHSEQAREAKKLQGALYLDSAEGLLAGGENGAVIIKGKGSASPLVKGLRYEGLEMPPAGRLPDEIAADFTKWIDLGAPDPRTDGVPLKPKREIDIERGRQWWSFLPSRPVSPPALPAISDGNPIDNPIDRFIIASQIKQGLKPNVPESREKLVRRAYFDLIGLPPSPEQLDAFLIDKSPQAFEKVVDRLLESPAYGEKWSRHWLDAARYAESGGYEFDGFRPGAYHYRDWVIRALNSDLPYDRFIRLQLAGDKLRPDDYDGAASSGFLVAGPYPGQITAKTVERIRYDQLDDMLMTIGGSMLGLTLGCVRCHEHKYDPIPQQDYYALAATFHQTVHGSRTFDPNPAATRLAQERHRAGLEPLAAALHRFATDELPKRFETWRTVELPKQLEPPRWQTLEPVRADAERSWLKWLPDGLVVHDVALNPGTMIFQHAESRQVPGAEAYRVAVRTFQKNIASLRIDMFADKSLPQRGPGLNGDGSFQLSEIKVVARPLDPQATDPPLDLRLKPIFAAFADPDQPLAHATDGKPESAWVVRTTAKADNAAVLELETPLAGFAGGTELVFELRFLDLGLGRLRFSFSTEPNPATWAGNVVPQHLGEIRAMLAANNNQLAEPLRNAMVQWFSPFDVDTAKVWHAVRDHAIVEPRPPLSEVYTTTSGGQDVFLLRRGEVDNKDRKAEPGFIQVLMRADQNDSPKVSASTTTPSGATPPVPQATTGSPVATAPSTPSDPRTAIADWITDVDRGAGPLLARVIVNRLWQHHFGKGLVGTPNDFGVQGERPTHPELLEWLAAELIQGGWKLKPIHKQIMHSATYQQSHEATPENLAIDPENRYLWHFRPRRLDAELIRDALLAIGGNLDGTMYGPSVMDDSTRRSIYLRVKRSELSPLMTTFDAPEPTQSIGERISTTVPTQALAMMNSPLVRRQAEQLAQRIHATADAPLNSAVNLAYVTVLARRPTESERTRMLAFIEQQRTITTGAESSGADRPFDRAIVEFCQVLLCLNEFVYVD